MNDGPRAGGREEQLGLFHRDGGPAVPPPAGNAAARDLYRLKNLWQATRECRRTKRGTLNVLAFEWDAEAGLHGVGLRRHPPTQRQLLRSAPGPASLA